MGLFNCFNCGNSGKRPEFHEISVGTDSPLKVEKDTQTDAPLPVEHVQPSIHDAPAVLVTEVCDLAVLHCRRCSLSTSKSNPFSRF
jgi:hypothetical protein